MLFKGPPDRFKVKLTNITIRHRPVKIISVYLVGIECFDFRLIDIYNLYL